MDFWKDKKVFITGHTGFKGSWLSLWLQKRGAIVIGYSLEPNTKPNMFTLADVEPNMISIIGDIKDKEKLSQIISEYKPEIIFHLAAQPIVRKSYTDPIETFETNIIGTLALFEALRGNNFVKAIVNVTTDKCYENKEWFWGYRENDTLGGSDPYSCSKSCVELITNCYRNSFFKKDIPIATVRAGNVIGGGDWAQDRIVPDIINSIINNEEIIIRNPDSIRPWQHVLEPLFGYMLLAQKMYENGQTYCESWNFGPSNEVITVEELVRKLTKLYGNEVDLVNDIGNNPKESRYLKLDSTKSKQRLEWETKLSIDKTLEFVAEWYKAWNEDCDMKEITLKQIESYENLIGGKF